MDKRACSSADMDLMDFPTELYTHGAIWAGELEATLDMKAWGKSMNLFCYFTSADGFMFRLSAFRANKGPGKDKWYTPHDGMLDMSNPDIQPGQTFLLTSSLNSKGNPRWDSAKLL
jgi:hypothetical protein